MSWQAMSAVNHHSQVTHNGKFRLLLFLADYADANGRVDPAPNQSTQAEHFNCSNRTIRTWVNDLCAAGELTQTRVGSGPGNPSAFQINLPLPQSQDAMAETAEIKAEEAPNSPPSEGENDPPKAEISALKAEIEGLKAEISALKAEVGAIKAEVNSRNASAFESLKAEAKGGKAEVKGGKGGKAEASRRKHHSSKSAYDPFDPYLIQKEGPPTPLTPISGISENQLSPQETAMVQMVNALGDVTFLDGHLNFRALRGLADELLPAYTPEQILIHYSPNQSPNGHWNWYLHDWRGQRNNPPSPPDIRKTIKAAVAGIIPKPPPSPTNRGANIPAVVDTGLVPDANGLI